MINQHLTEKEFLMKSDTIIDATLISEPSSTRNESLKSAPKMSSNFHSGKYNFGMKAYIGADVQSVVSPLRNKDDG